MQYPIREPRRALSQKMMLTGILGETVEHVLVSEFVKVVLSHSDYQ